MPNNALPQNGQFFNGNEFIQGTANEKGNGFDFADIGSITKPNDLTMNVHQNEQNAVIKWDSFDVGGSATVNFTSDKSNFNTLNYVNSGAASQIYGTINASGGNIYIVNPAGVQIGNSAQINVGSLYVSNNEMNDDNFNHFMNNADPNNIINYALQGKSTEAALMSLGNINATFEGDGRIVIDSERLKDVAGTEKLTADKIFVNTKDKNNVVIGYDAYENGSYANVINTQELVTLNGSEKLTKADGYMWVEDVNQLQDINTNLSGNYALRNSIDATSTEQKGFTSIGSDNDAFKGKFDGIDYNIFGLTINGGDNTGLFGYTNNATISNVTLVGGSITGSNNVGAIVGNANNTTLTNVVNSAAVSGVSNVGGIVGRADDSAIKDAINTGTINGSDYNVGGLIGNLQNSKLDTTKEVEKGLIGNSYNLGDVSGDGYNVGGLVGSALNSTIGNPSVVNGKPVENVETVYNRMDVTGAYNVGGIVGNMEGTTVQNAENSGTVTASGYTNGYYQYHTNQNNIVSGADGENEKIASVEVAVANVGGIAGNSSDDSHLANVNNSGDVSSDTQVLNKGTANEDSIYTAGNVGGIVGSAVNTNIENATNEENSVRGAHNVGGIAGYFGSMTTNANDKFIISNGINNGGDILATGARNIAGNQFIKEQIRPGDNNEIFNVGNMGGIAGYMYGDNVYIQNSANRGTVHSADIEGANVLDSSKAANTGGIVGKIDRSSSIDINDLKDDSSQAAVYNSYNTGDVRGYTGVGGIAGMMYNGEIAESYNLGAINTTRQVNNTTIDPLNLGGIVGDTTELTKTAKVSIYDVYNKGQIGDDTYTYFGRHVGGIIGRLSGDVEKAYNNGAIYNASTVTGGIVGWWYNGDISNVFNTGNITVINSNTNTRGSEVGGIVGGVDSSISKTLNNAYNLGTLRSFATTGSYNSVGGIIGDIHHEYNGVLTISNVYTTGNLYAGSYNEQTGESTYNNKGVGSIYGYFGEVKDGGSGAQNVTGTDYANRVKIEDAYYITPSLDEYTLKGNNNQATGTIAYAERTDSSKYEGLFDNDLATDADRSNLDGDWRIYDGYTTPILNIFTPNSSKYFGSENDTTGLDSNVIQYGTAYDPLLTIIRNAGGKKLEIDTQQLGLSAAGGLAVYNGSLSLSNFTDKKGNGYFGGIIYSDGTLSIESNAGDNIGLGSGSKLYGSSISIDAGGEVISYGDIISTGNNADSGNISINGVNVDIYGEVKSSAPGDETIISGIYYTADKNLDTPSEDTQNNISNPYKTVTSVENRYTYTIEAGSNSVGNINITANGTSDGSGNVNLYYGNKEEGLITTGGNLIVTGDGDVYVDSDLDIGGNLTLNGNGTNSEVVLDLTNIGQVQFKNGTVDDTVTGLDNFLEHFANTGTGSNRISFGNTQDAKITVDMWNGDTLNLEKFGSDFTGKLNDLNIIDSNGKKAQQLTHIWVTNGEQLKNIQKADKKALGYNFALKGDINASDVENYVAIGTGSKNGFTGTFDGRGNRVIGLKVNNNNANAGIFSTVGENGVVKNVNIYSGNFEGTNTAGAVAGVNNGRIENIVTFGNTITATEKNSNAGGIVGINNGNNGTVVTNEDGTIVLKPINEQKLPTGIIDVESTGSVIAGGSNAIAGGLVGTNNGVLGNSYSDSAVTSTANDNQAGLGGVVGVNKGDVQMVDSLGVTNGGTTGSSNVGGIIGINNGNMYSGYNESIVSGKDNVGGIIGDNSSTVANVVNATSVTGKDKDKDNVSEYVGGLVGTNTGSVTNGRNNGTITGTKYVGGLVGDNADENSILTNLVNDSSAEILGEEYVGGIAGSNSGKITSEDQTNLINRGSITGQNYVGGVAGENIGTIEYVKNDVSLNVKDTNKDASYFGGVAGINGRVDDENTDGVDESVTGTITNATNEGNVIAENASYVGGIVGHNTDNGVLEGMGNSNEGIVIGGSYVGGVIGKNDAAIGGTDKSQVGITNEGIVIAVSGGAGGLIGENNAAITNTIMTNKGEVHGNNANDGSGTGGLIGTNNEKGDITYSSMINEVTGTVTGVNNVGGLIGVNKADITGGRKTVKNEDSGYYVNKIYNNGVINVGTYTDKDKDGEYKFAAATESDNSTNVGGLFGTNSGKVEAAYNTGAINAENSTNVGGIAGTNSGTIDQVFNTVMVNPADKDQQAAAITGGNNVGGLIGTNSGTLSNAYNTTTVKAENGIAGNAVGVNDTNGTIENIYASNISGKLIGKAQGTISNAYSFSSDDAGSTVVKFVDDIDTDKDGIKDRVDKNSYTGFDFTNDWKNYDGSGNPLLKVFLTNLTIKDTNEDGQSLEEFLNLVYNGEEQDLNIKALIENGFIEVPDKEALKAHYNTVFGNTLGESHLINNTDGQKTAGKHNNWLYSEQIHENTVGEFNPNNLGYDITFANNDKGILEIDKAKLTITLDDIYRIYGQEGLRDGYDYGFSIDGLADSDQSFANSIIIKDNTIKDGALANPNNDGKVTNDVNDVDNPYKWTADVTLNEYISNNYNVSYDGGNSYVEKADLTITADDQPTMPGVMPDFTGTDINDELVNGDTISDSIYDYGVNIGTDITTDGTHTIGIYVNGKYYELSNPDWSSVNGLEFFKNYNVKFEPGTLTVNSELLPDLPDNWPSNRWDYLFNDAPFDSNKNFRERKAEVNFVDGGMEI